MTTYDNVVKAAQRLVTDDTRDTWGLANAVLDHVPSTGLGGDHGAEGSRVPSALADLASSLAKDGVTTPNGDPYSDSSLAELRKTAMAWNHNFRHPEAAYRTHQEAGSPNTEGGKVLDALCAVARGESPAKPRGTEATAWAKAVTRVQSRRKGFPVAANDIRIALQRKPNVPGPSRGPVTPQDVKDAIDNGDLSPSDVADVLPSDTLVGTYLDRQNQAPPLTEGMTPDEIASTQQMVSALQSAVSGLDAMGKDATEGWWQHDIIRAQGLLVSVLRYIAADMDADLRQFLMEHVVEIRRVLDLIEMKGRGSDLPDEVEAFLATQASHE